jgi:hypothetical protein
MGGAAMSRYWVAIPLAVVLGLPLWIDLSWPVAVLQALALLFCAAGLAVGVLGLMTAGCALAVIGYAAALWLSAADVDVVAGAIFGFAQLFTLDLSQFERRFRGAAVADDVMKAQWVFWFGRAAVIAVAVAALILAAWGLSLLVPSAGRAVVAGIGAIIVFAAALYAGVVRTEPGDG